MDPEDLALDLSHRLKVYRGDYISSVLHSLRLTLTCLDIETSGWAFIIHRGPDIAPDSDKNVIDWYCGSTLNLFRDKFSTIVLDYPRLPKDKMEAVHKLIEGLKDELKLIGPEYDIYIKKVGTVNFEWNLKWWSPRIESK